MTKIVRLIKKKVKYNLQIDLIDLIYLISLNN